MKAEDLMIGDWVHWQNRAIDPDIWLDTPIRELQGDHCHLEYGGGDPFDYDEIEPIPLTPEILEKNGFVKGWPTTFELVQQTDDGRDLKFLVVYKLEKKHLRIDSYTADTGIFSSFGISFVHQLQQALRLCGIEKKIIL